METFGAIYTIQASHSALNAIVLGRWPSLMLRWL